MKAVVLLLLGVAPWPATLQDCDAEWRMRGQRPPRAAIVVNQTTCEPYRHCSSVVQGYVRTCAAGQKRRVR